MAFITKIGAGVDAWLDSRQSISKKIGYGYGVAISIAALGALLGLAIGSHAQQQAQEALEIAEVQQNKLNKLSLLSISLQSHPQRLLVVLQEPIWFQYEMSKFTNDFNQAKASLAELDSFIEQDASQENLDVDTLETLVQNYSSTIEGYRQYIAALWKRVNPQDLTRGTAAQAQQLIVASLADEEAIRIRLRFEKLSERLVQMQRVAENQKIQAYYQLNQADTFRFHAIILGIVLSTAIAIALGMVTSRAIARPVQVLTDVAQQSIQDAKFDLQASVSSNDEIGSLAQSFNQLIAFVNQLLQQQQAANEKLEAYSQSLEQKVLLHTQELQEKNDHLKQLLEELHRTQTQMVQSEKMSSLGQLVAGVAHEINNPVNFIHGNLEHLNAYTQDLIKLVQSYEKLIPDPPSSAARNIRRN
jgi:two-component system NtrC family sensor kinase